MTFQKLSFDDALSQGQLEVRLSDVVLDRLGLSSIRVQDLEQGAAIVLFWGQIRMDRQNYLHLLRSGIPLKIEERAAIRDNSNGVGYYWAKDGSTVHPILPRAPYLPNSNALEFLTEVYNSTLTALSSKGKAMLD